ncbi:MAG: hypothetical protein EHM28_01495 [Spirochaetaceae bacterium]|nr:MAG: hypothetical protein EHM28_01495 [Spirochaetaceae bacterium]
MAAGKKHSEHFHVRPSEVDFRGWLSVGCLAGYLQDTAGVHANLLGFGVGDLLRKNMTWMLSRFRLEILRRTDCGEDITVTTWPSGSEKLFTYREFSVTDRQDRLVAKSSTAWLTIEIKPENQAKKILRPQKELEPFYLSERDR